MRFNNSLCYVYRRELLSHRKCEIYIVNGLCYANVCAVMWNGSPGLYGCVSHSRSPRHLVHFFSPVLLKNNFQSALIHKSLFLITTCITLDLGALVSDFIFSSVALRGARWEFSEFVFACLLTSISGFSSLFFAHL